VDLKLTASNQNVTAETQAPSAPSQDQGEKPADLELTASKQNVTAETQAPSAPSQDQGEKPRKKFLGLF
jgi:hypothetical protein